MMRRLTAILLALSLLITLSGCSGGSVYSNLRETEELSVIDAIGLDRSEDGFTLSVASGTKVSRSADAKSIALARERLLELSPREQLFFAHTKFVAVGEKTAEESLTPVLDCVERSNDLRLNTPVIIIADDEAKTLLTKTEDSVSMLRSYERECEKRGDCRIFSASEIISSLDRYGFALASRVRLKLDDKGKVTAILPDGYSLIKDSRELAHIPSKEAACVELITNRAGPFFTELELGDAKAVLQLNESKCRLEDGVLKLELKASLYELEGSAKKEELERAYSEELKSRIEKLLELAERTDCDYLKLGGWVERLRVSSELKYGYDLEA